MESEHGDVVDTSASSWLWVYVYISSYQENMGYDLSNMDFAL
jgi:hypothetical protein